MSKDDAAKCAVDQLFNRILASQKIDDIAALEWVLPNDPDVLRDLGAKCLQEARKAQHAARHIEGRRFDILGRQLQRRADAEE